MTAERFARYWHRLEIGLLKTSAASAVCSAEGCAAPENREGEERENIAGSDALGRHQKNEENVM